MSEKITNANERARVYYCKHMTAGLTGYANNPAVKGNVLVTSEVMQKMAPSLVGVPIYVGHVDDNSTQKEVGRIADSKYCSGDGYLHAKMLICDDEADRLINQGWSVSNGYTPTNKAGSGTHNSIAYEQEVLDGSFFHMALTQNPRYEKAEIFTEDEYSSYMKNLDQKMLNSKGEKVLPESKSQDKISVNNSKSEHMTEETIKNDVEKVEKKEPNDKKQNEAKEPEKKKPDFMNEKVTVNDKEMTVKELVNAYSAFLKKSEKDKKENEEKGKKDKLTNDVSDGADWHSQGFINNNDQPEAVDYNKIGNERF